MAEKQCGKCGEMVDEAKAFCPGCGHSFVDEKQRSTISDFDQSKHTVQLGETMFNQMLSEMGLNTSKAPAPGDENANVVTPLAPAVIASTATKGEIKPSQASPDKRTKIIWIAVIVLAAVVLAIVVILAAVGVLYFYYR